MRLKLIFKSTGKVYDHRLNEEVNGFIHKVLGENNKYHGSFSDYSISDIMGMRYSTDHVTYSFPKFAYVFVSSPNDEFMNDLLNGLSNLKNGYVLDMPYCGMEICDFSVNSQYDIIRIKYLSLRNKRQVITVNNDEFLDSLRDKCVKKLMHNGVSAKAAKTLNFEIFHKENSRINVVKTKGIPIRCSSVMLIVRGNKNARLKLYELGVGQSTGFGFGAVSLTKEIF